MVSNRCILAVKEELEKLGFHNVIVKLGEVNTPEDILDQTYSQFKAALNQLDFDLMEDKRIILSERIKTLIIEMIHYNEYTNKVNLSDYLSEKLEYDYTYLSTIFSEFQGGTIEHFMISNRIERIKELLMYNELTISEIAWKLNFSSVGHLSNQFKKFTGISPLKFKQLKDRSRIPIERIGIQEFS